MAPNVVLLCMYWTRSFGVIWSSDEAHTVDALAATGDEGRGSLRKASGSWQTSFDPGMSEWGNPAWVTKSSMSDDIEANSGN